MLLYSSRPMDKWVRILDAPLVVVVSLGLKLPRPYVLVNE